jgi:SHS2 domain-containing protein
VIELAADVGASVRGRTLRHLFENATAALLDLGGGRDTVAPKRRVRLRVKGATLEDLLVRWLSEILYRQEAGGWRFRSCHVEALDPRRLVAAGTMLGERLDPERHAPGREIKAVTYHQMRIRRARGAWRVRVFFDV